MHSKKNRIFRVPASASRGRDTREALIVNILRFYSIIIFCVFHEVFLCGKWVVNPEHENGGIVTFVAPEATTFGCTRYSKGINNHGK